jgi:hypothetical protein
MISQINCFGDAAIATVRPDAVRIFGPTLDGVFMIR